METVESSPVRIALRPDAFVRRVDKAEIHFVLTDLIEGLRLAVARSMQTIGESERRKEIENKFKFTLLMKTNKKHADSNLFLGRLR